MKLNKTARILASLALGLSLCVVSCEKPATNIVIAPPNTHPSTGTGTGNGNGNGSGSGGGSGDNNGGSGPSTGSGTETGTLCTDIGQTPIVLAYFTEYTETLPEVKLLTHINYAHGRFKNPKTGDGGIVITESSKAPISKVVALKSVNPKLKVMLMIGGWGGQGRPCRRILRNGQERRQADGILQVREGAHRQA